MKYLGVAGVLLGLSLLGVPALADEAKQPVPRVGQGVIESMGPASGTIPKGKLATIINRYSDNPAALRDAGLFYATEQIMDLLENGVQGIHLYTMNNVQTATRISTAVESIIAAKNSANEA